MRADTFVSYAAARFRKEQEHMAFMNYIADALYLRARGKAHSKRWIDQIRPKNEDIDPKAVVDDLVERAGLVVK